MKTRTLQLLTALALCITGLCLTNTNVSVSIIQFLNREYHSNLDLFFRTKSFFALGFMLTCTGLLMILKQPVLKIPEMTRGVMSGLVLLLAFILLILQTKENVPVFDEYTSLFRFLCDFKLVENPGEKFHLIFNPYFECRIPIPYLFVMGIQTLHNGILPLDIIISINALLLFMIVLLLFQSLEAYKSKIYLFPWILFFVFHTEYMQSSFNALSGMCYNGATLFTLLSFRANNKRVSGSVLKSQIFAIMAMYTFGNGLLVIPLLFHQTLMKDGLKGSLKFMLPILAAAILYFIGFHPLSAGKGEFNLIHFLIYIPVFLGSMFQFFYLMPMPFIAGSAILVLYIYVSWKRYYLKNPSLYYTFSFIILTAVLTAFFRSPVALDSALRLRYGIFSSLAVYCSVLIALDFFPSFNRKNIRRSVSLAAVAYNLASAFFFYPESVLTIEHNKILLKDWSEKGQIDQEASAYYPGGLEDVLSCSQTSGLWKYMESWNDERQKFRPEE